jgi:hypothetical protein
MESNFSALPDEHAETCRLTIMGDNFISFQSIPTGSLFEATEISVELLTPS